MPAILFNIAGVSRNRVNTRMGIPAIIAGRTPLPAIKLLISGVTKDSSGVILGSCTVTLFRTDDDLKIDEVVSDATTGQYLFTTAGHAENYYIVAYKAGSPDVSGTTVNTLTGA